MHFIDRSLFKTPPLAELKTLHDDEQPKWLAYKKYLADKSLTLVNKPDGKWIKDSIRTPLISLFNTNCAYCGDFTQKSNDGEVDHFFPKEIDEKAEYIYSWDNYVWACHSCNNKKRENYPLINPCDANEVKEIYFHSADGRYLAFSTASKDIQEKYLLTDTFTYINGKSAPERRRNIHKQLHNIYLYEISLRHRLLDVELLSNPNSNNVEIAEEKLEYSKEELKEFLSAKDFILLKRQVFQDYKLNNGFPYEYDDFV